jgi:RNA polymerase sigma-70 factor (ECF subfamily)
MGAEDGRETFAGPGAGATRRGSAAAPINPAAPTNAVPVDPAALGGWFDAYGAALVLYARQWLDRSAAEDVVQEVFVRLMGQSARHRPANVRAWLYRATRNAAIGAARSLWRRGRRERDVARDHAEWFQPHPEDPIDARAAQAALQSLPAAQREIILLRLWSGMTLAEIADVTGGAVTTVHDHYRKGLAGVRQVMESRSQPCSNDKTNKAI